MPAISADGRYVVFASAADNLAAGDTNGARDIFVRDRQTEETRLVSVSTAGVAGNNNSSAPSISADGSYIAFASGASDLVANDTNSWSDIFISHWQTGEITRVSVGDGGNESDGDSVAPAISADGRYVVFESAASNLVAGDTNLSTDIFLYNRQLGVTTRVSASTDGGEGNASSFQPAISADGRYVVFASYASNLVANDTNDSSDAFVRDLQTSETTRVSLPSFGDESNEASYTPAISADGRYVVFTSDASNLVSGDTNGDTDVFLRDTQNNQTSRVSVSTSGVQANSTSSEPDISGDGRYIVFASYASKLVFGDGNEYEDIFLHDVQTGQTRRMSVSSVGTQANGDNFGPAISGDGRYLAYSSSASNLVAGGNYGWWTDILVADVAALLALPVPPPPLVGSGIGLKGEYFNNIDLSGSLAMARLDPQVDFNWIEGAPSSEIAPDNFSVRWTGQIEPQYSDAYSFQTESSDGVRLWVNGQLLIDDWAPHDYVNNYSDPITLTAGQRYDIRLEYFESDGFARVQLYWSSDSTPKEAVPSTQLYTVAGPAVGIQVLLPGEVTAPLTATGKAGAPDTQTAGIPFNVTVRAVDAEWNTVTTATDTAALASTDSLAELPGTVALVNGTATVPVTLKTAAAQTLQATDLDRPDFAEAVSAPVTVASNTALTLELTAPNSAQQSNPISVSVTARDAYGNLATSYTGTIHFTSSDSGASLPADYTFATGNGTATLTNGVTFGNGGVQTLTATDINDPALTATATIQVVGELVVTNGQTVTVDDVRYALTTLATAGDTSLPLNGTTGIVSSDELLIITMLGNGIGTFETVVVDQINADSVTLVTPLANSYNGLSDKVMIQRVPHYLNVLVQSGGVVTAHAWDGATGGIVFFRANNVTVETGGKIDASGLGFRPDEGPGSGGYQDGGGYGGYGNGSGGGVGYGSVLLPNLLGSAGGNYSASQSTGNNAGTPGGGIIRLHVTGTLLVDGLISADGKSIVPSSVTVGGAGAGGSIWLEADAVAGEGTIRANGGQSYYFDTLDGGHIPMSNGSGGRVAAYYASHSFTGKWETATVAYIGGLTGGPGTIYLENTAQDYRKLKVDNKNINGRAAILTDPQASTWTFDEIELVGKGHLELLDSDDTIQLASANMVGDNTAQLYTHGSLSFADADLSGFGLYLYPGASLALLSNTTLRGITVTNYGTVNGAQSLTLSGATLMNYGTLNGNLDLTLSADGTSNSVARLGTSGQSAGQPAGTYTFGSVLVEANQILELEGDLATGYGVTISATNVTVAVNGKISADGLGYTPAQKGPGAPTGSDGAGHGGYGGGTLGGAGYGSVAEPVTLGSSGGGYGGGAVKLTVADTLTVNGILSAGGSGNGAGGSLWLNTQTLTGIGAIRANGGTNSSGGRIATYYVASTYSGLWEAVGNTNGGAGTIYWKDLSTGNDKLRVDNQNHDGRPAVLAASGATTWVFGEIELIQKGHLELLDPDDTILLNNAIGDGTAQVYLRGAFTFTGPELDPFGFYVYESGTLTLPATVTVRGAKLTNYGTLSGAQTLTIAANGAQNAIVRLGATGQSAGQAAGTYAFTTVNVEANQTLELAGDPATGLGVTLVADDVTVTTGATISADNLGYTPSQPGPGAPVLDGDGAGHGGVGGYHGAGGYVGGSAYGSVREPIDLGSASQVAGGGAIKLVVADTLVINGRVSANGRTNTGEGAGAGGSIWIVAGTLIGQGAIAANGGYCYNYYASTCGAGSGGRIATYYTTNSFSGLWEAFGGYSNYGYHGGAGTIYLKDLSTGYDKLLVDNENREGPHAVVTDSTVTAWEFDEIRLAGKGHLEFPDVADTLKLTPDTQLAGDGSATLYTRGTIDLLLLSEVRSEVPLYVYETGSLQFAETVAIKGTILTNLGTVGGVRHLSLSSDGVRNSTLRLSAPGYSQGLTPGLYEFDTVAVDSGQTLELAGNPASGAGVTLLADSITVAGHLSADGLGYTPAQNGPGAPTAYTGGGGHGGAGGGPTYGSIQQPDTLGSAGGSSLGGGYVRLIINGTLDIPAGGIISANGGDAVSTSYGAGAGGTVRISAASITGAGAIEANGDNRPGTSGSGGGGGGRIAILAEEISPQVTITASGGSGSTDGGQGSVSVGGVDAGASTVEANPTVVVADGSATSQLTITVKDATGLPISNKYVQVFAAPGNSVNVNGAPVSVTGFVIVGPSDQNGQITANVSGTVIGEQTITVKSGPVVVLDQATVIFIPGPVDAVRSSLETSAVQGAADGHSVITATVTLRDAFDNPIAGATVQLAATGNAVVTQPTVTTDANGVAQGTVADATAETVVISATGNGVSIADTATVTFVGADIVTTLNGPTQAGFGAPITYTLTVRNDGLATAPAVMLVDTLPVAVSYLSDTAPVPVSQNGQQLSWQLGDLAPGQQVTFSLMGQVADDATPGVEVVNTATATSGVFEENPSDNTASATTTLIAPDVAIGLAGEALSNEGLSSTKALSGFSITYTLTVTNAALGAARNLTVTDTLPAGLTFASQQSGYAYQVSGDTITWEISALADGETATIQLVANIGASVSGNVTNQAAVTTTTSEANLDNNTASLVTTVEAPTPSLTISPATPTLAVLQGSNASLTATIRNTGLGEITGLVVTPPPNIPWVTLNTAGTTQTLSPGQETTFVMTATADSALTLGYYRDLITVTEASGSQKSIALTVQVKGPTRTVQVTVNNDQGQVVPGAILTMTREQASVIVTEGSTSTYYQSAQGVADSNGLIVLGDLEIGNYSYTLSADHYEIASGTVVVVAGDGVQTLSLDSLVGLPALAVSPDAPVLLVTQDATTQEWGSAAQEIEIRNDGNAPLTNVAITTPASIPWVYLGTPGLIPAIAPGERLSFSILASPPAGTLSGSFSDSVTVSADGQPPASVALTVRLAAETTQSLKVNVVGANGRPVRSGGAITLTEQALTVQTIGGVETTFHQQFSALVDENGVAQFTGLPPGDYNYLLQVEGYEQGAGTLLVNPLAATDPVQEATLTARPAPFTYSWVVDPITQEYDIELTLTYDIHSPEPGVVIPPRYWSVSSCTLNDVVALYNPTDIPLDVSGIVFNVPGVAVTVGAHPGTIPANGSIGIPVTVTRTGEPGEGIGQVNFTYQQAADPFVTFTLNPSSRTSQLQLGQTFTDTYQINPGVFTPGVLYALQLTQPVTLPWATLTTDQTLPLAWNNTTAIPLTLAVDTPGSLDNGVYQDNVDILVTGSDGSERSGQLVIEITKTDTGLQLHTNFALDPVPTMTKAGVNTGVIQALPGDGQNCGASGGGWIWSVVGSVSGGKVVGGRTGSRSLPAFPQFVPPPEYGNGYQQVRLSLDQRVMLEGEGFHAKLALNNASESPLDVVSVDIVITDPNDNSNQNDKFTITPSVPTDLGNVAAEGGQASEEWLILPTGLNVTDPNGQKFNVEAVINYTWNGVPDQLRTAPEEITVLPAPNLKITYVLPETQAQCNLWGLEVVIKNIGPGTARNVRFSSSQMQLEDPNTHIPISFQIKRTFVTDPCINS